MPLRYFVMNYKERDGEKSKPSIRHIMNMKLITSDTTSDIHNSRALQEFPT